MNRIIIPLLRNTSKRQLATAATTEQPSFMRRHSGKLVSAFLVGLSGYTVYAINEARHPVQQKPMDPSKKNLVILGSGWAATSILKDLDTEHFNVTVISPRNYFLFTPLLPSCTVGTIELRSIMQPMRYITRHKSREVNFVEGDCTDISPDKKVVTVQDNSELVGAVSRQSIPYDYLVVAVGAENATFGIPGVRENACFLKEIWDARKIRTKLMDCLETAAFPGQSKEEIERLLHMVVVGGGPTGVEYAAELRDFLVEDLKDWYPDIAGKIKITLIEALPHVLPMFSKQLIQYTEEHFAENKVDIKNNTKVKEVKPREIVVQNAQNEIESIPYGLIVWATGNTARPVVSDLIKKLPQNIQNQRRGLVVDDYLQVKGADGIYALGDCSATKYPPTAQVASRQGKYLSKRFNEIGTITEEASQIGLANENIAEKLSTLEPFEHESLGMLAYIGSDTAIADFPGSVKIGGALTFYFWRSAYLSNLFSLRNKILVASDWIKKTVFGRDIGRE